MRKGLPFPEIGRKTAGFSGGLSLYLRHRPAKQGRKKSRRRKYRGG
jgi:hypothetical protein